MATAKQTTKAQTTKKQTIKVTGADGVYDAAELELQRLAKDDAASRKVDKALEEARGKDTVRLHAILMASSVADQRAQSRHDEAINLAESNQTTTADLVQKSQAAVLRDLKKAREELLNGQAVLGEAATKAEKAAKASFTALEKTLSSVHESITKSQESDGKAILKLLKEQQTATLELVQSVYNDLDTKVKHFREEVADDLEKMSTTQGNQNASVRGDMNVVLSLLSDIRKDQIGRPERR